MKVYSVLSIMALVFVLCSIHLASASMYATYSQVIPAMTSNNTPSPYIAYASTSTNGLPPYQAFDKNESDYWQSTGDPSNSSAQWIALDFGASNSFEATNITMRNAITGTTDIREFGFQGANDNSSDSNWVTLYNGTGLNSVYNITYNFTSNNVKYRYYRIHIRGDYGATTARLDELYIWRGNSINATLVSPANATISSNLTQTLTWTVTDPIKVSNTTLFIDGVANYTNTSGVNGTYSVTQVYSLGSHNWSVGATSNRSFTVNSSNATFTVAYVSVNTATYNATTYETSSESYTLNATVSTSISVAYIIGTFYYNGTSYSSTGSTSGNNFNLTNTLDIPIGSTGSKNFYWNIELILSNGSSLFFNTSTLNQTVSALSLTSCTSATNLTYNFTSALETNLTALSPFNFYSTIEYWIGSGTTKKNLSINNASVNYSGLCISPTGNYRVNANIEYGKSGYVSRNYYLTNASATTSVMNVTLYLLDTATATGFIINLKGSDGLPIEGAYIYLNKYYAGLGSTKTVAMAKTDESGASVVYLEADVTDYQIIVVEDGEVTYTSPIQKVYCSSTPCTLDIQTSGSGISSWSPIGNFSDLTYTMTFNTTDDVVSYSYVDTTGATSYARLFVYTLNPANGTSTICNTYSNSSASTLTCDTTGYTGVIYSEGYISRSPEVLVWAESFVRDTVKDIMGTNGLFWALIIIMALSIGGAVVGSVTGGIIGAVIGLIFMPFLGVASFGMVTIWGVIIIGVFIIWRVKN